ncbi:MAG: hypothetical protein MMC33_002179 [Icmadophila ericetorum]|nr:hypothetical protein [Icmadophila ericetorum]
MWKCALSQQCLKLHGESIRDVYLRTIKSKDEEWEEERDGLQEFYRVVSVKMVTIGRRAAVSKQGFFGLVPKYAKVGDQLYVLPGGQMLYVLRPLKDEDEGCFKVIGESHVHGLMDGEVMDWVKEGKANICEIRIK